MSSYLNYIFGGLWKKSEKSLTAIQGYFRQHGGGHVELTLGVDGLAVLVLNQAEKRNALSGKMMAELCDAVETLENWPTGKGLLIHGAGIGFCSGADLDFLRENTSDTIASELSRLLTDCLARLRALPLVSVAYVHGFGAIGGGAELSLAADIRVMSPASRIAFVHGKMGLTPAWGSAARLIQTVGRAKALDILLTGRSIPSEEAMEIGLAQMCGDLNFAEGYLKSLCNFSPAVIGSIKSVVTKGEEEEVFTSLFGKEDHKKALLASIKHTE